VIKEIDYGCLGKFEKIKGMKKWWKCT